MSRREFSYGLVVITRDRPASLCELLPWLHESVNETRCQGVALVDDSVNADTVLRNGALVSSLKGGHAVFHLTRDEQNVLRERAFSGAGVGALMRPLGELQWNIGSSRNTGILFWLMQKAAPEVLIFIDDDLIPLSKASGSLERIAVTAYRKNALIGLRLGGMPDESMLKRLIRSLRDGDVGNELYAQRSRKDAYPISGGCVAIPAELLRVAPFYSIYNEDWIFFLEGEHLGYKHLLMEEKVFAQRESPLDLGPDRLKREAYGEIQFRVLWRLPFGSRRIESLARCGDLWRASCAQYNEEVAEAVRYCKERGRLNWLPSLRDLKTFVAGLEPDARHLGRILEDKSSWRERLFLDSKKGV